MAQESHEEVQVGPKGLAGTLSLPAETEGLVLFAHGSGSSRLSPRNGWVAERLRESGLGTLLFDLLSESEAQDRDNVFDIPLLGSRVSEAIAWAQDQARLRPLRIGLFGASTGGGAALVAAADMPQAVAAVVSRGGRPDLAGERLPDVRAPTLLIVGGADQGVLDLNREALERLQCTKSLQVVPHATHLFEERGALDQVVVTATEWFQQHLGGSRDREQ